MNTAQQITSMPQQSQTSALVLADENVEAAFLGHLLLGVSSEDFRRYAHLTEDHFNADRHKRLWRVMNAIVADGMQIDLTQVKLRLHPITEAGEKFLLEIMTQAGSQPLDYARALQLIEWQRDVDTQLLSAIRFNHGPKVTHLQIAAHLSQVGTQLQIKAAALLGPMAYNAPMLHEQHFDALMSPTDQTFVGTPTGFSDLDKAIGGFERKRVYLIGAPTGGGKSIIAQRLLMECNERGCPSFLVSFELPETEYMLRALSMESRVELDRIKAKRINEDEVRRVYEARKRLDSVAKIGHSLYMPLPTLDQLRAKITEMVFAHGIGLVALDYLAARRFKRRKDDPKDNNQFMGVVSAEIIDMAKALNITIIELAQTNRSSQQRGGKPEVTDFAEASALEQDADFAAILQTEEPYNVVSGYGITALHILKGRTGGEGDIVRLEARKAMFRFDTMRGQS